MIHLFLKLTQAVSLLALSVIGLIVALVFIQATTPKEPGGCGVIDTPKFVCGNYMNYLPPKGISDSLKTVFTQGKKLFNYNCSQCHTEFTDVIVGPGMKGILERRKVSWLIPFIQDSQKMIAAGDTAAVNLFNKYNQAQMQSFQLTEQEVSAILFYVGNMGSHEIVYIDPLPPPKID